MQGDVPLTLWTRAWACRLPVVAPCDRTRVMGLWAKYCGDMVPQEHMLDFAKVRSLSPEQFVEKLAFELKVKGVVAGTIQCLVPSLPSPTVQFVV